MQLKSLKLHQFRNFPSLELSFCNKINYFFGDNGSGKTSILEAIHYLSTGHSFRTRLHEHVIQHEKAEFSIYAQIERDEQIFSAGVSRSVDGKTRYRLNNTDLASIVEITRLFPVQIITPDSRKIFILGPKQRRQFIDWGVFHVEHSYYAAWQELMRSLKQRNALLKMESRDAAQREIWDHAFLQAAGKVDVMRANYMQAFDAEIQPLLHLLLPDFEIQLNYRRGWDSNRNLAEVLSRDWARDKILKFTQHGPQKADLELFANNKPVLDILSQGQQKLLLYALLIAQGILLFKKQQQACIFLIDDILAELDRSRFMLLLKLLNNIEAQIFLTSVEMSPLISNLQQEAKMFHVEHGLAN